MKREKNIFGIKRALVLLSLSVLLTSCFGQKEEKIILDKEDEKIIEQVLDMTNTGTEVKNEEEVVKEMEKEETVVNNKDDSVIVKEDEVKVGNDIQVGNEIKVDDVKISDNVNESKNTQVEVTPEEEKEAEDLLKDLLGTESVIKTAEEEVNNVK